jgi:hypothetical protein
MPAFTIVRRYKSKKCLLSLPFRAFTTSWIGHIIRHSEFVVNILEGAIPGKKAMGKPRLRYLKQVARYIGADRYTTMKRIACNKSRWKAANQSKD